MFMSFAPVPDNAIETKPTGNVCEKIMNLLWIYFSYLDKVKKQEGVNVFSHPLPGPPTPQLFFLYPHSFYSSSLQTQFYYGSLVL